MKTIKLAAITLLSVVALNSCKKEDENKLSCPKGVESEKPCESVKGENHALLVIDMQNDFCDKVEGYKPTLPVTEGTSVIPYINKLVQCQKFSKVVFSKDWHSMGHVSFASSHEGKKPFETIKLDDGSVQALWPDHCVPNTKGSEFHGCLDTSRKDFVVKKGTKLEVDSYSAFLDNNKKDKTGLDKYLKSQGVKEVTVVGLALDFCVKATCIDAIDFGYKVNLHLKGTKAVFPDKQEAVIKELKAKGVTVIE